MAFDTKSTKNAVEEALEGEIKAYQDWLRLLAACQRRKSVWH